MQAVDSVHFEDLNGAGLNRERLEILRVRARHEIEEGLLPSAQFAVARNGRVVWAETFGNADNQTLYPIFSCTKAIMSAAAWLVIQDGQLDVDERVGDIIPQFDTNGKEEVRVVDLFLHTAGFPMAPFRPLDWDDVALRNGRFAQWRLNWPTRSKFEYHPSSSMWVIAEIVERKTGKDFREFIRERVVDPLGLDGLFVGLPDDQNHRVAELTHVGDPMTSEDYARLGLPEPPVTEVTEDAILSFNRPQIRAVGVPGGGGMSTASALALFYQGLLHGGKVGASRLWSPETLSFGLRVISDGYFDPFSGVRVNRALGLVVAGDERRNFRGFGHTNSPAAFGHAGAGGQVAWGDPESGLSFVYLTNGHDRNPMRLGRRGVSLSTKAASLCD